LNSQESLFFFIHSHLESEKNQIRIDMGSTFENKVGKKIKKKAEESSSLMMMNIQKNILILQFINYSVQKLGIFD